MDLNLYCHGTKKLICLGVFFSSLVIAHDTNTTHPRLTIAAGELIKSNDSDSFAYYELYKTSARVLNDDNAQFPYLLGQDPRFNETLKKADEGSSPIYPKFRHDLRNVLDGVVMEDEPLNRVFSHFQHAYTEEPMNLDWVSWLNRVAGMYGKTNKSEDTAKQFFYDSVEIMGLLVGRQPLADKWWAL